MQTASRFIKTVLVAALTLLGASLHAGESKETNSIADAIQAAGQQHRPVLIDFHAVWCYSCYYMASHVLNGPAWDAVEHKAIVVEADADSPDGQAWLKKLKVSFLPSYVVLDEHGNELGRIAAEQPREKFYPQINAIIANGRSLDTLKAKAASGSVDAVAGVLGAYKARDEGEEGLQWFASLSAPVRDAAGKNPRVALALGQLGLAKAQAANDDEAVIASAQRVLAGPIGCERPYVLDALLDASKRLGAAQRTALLAPQRQPLDHYLNAQVLTAKPTCVDQRSAVLASANLDAALGDHAAEAGVLDRAIKLARQGLGDDVTRDRNLADNLRVYLARAKRTDELDVFQRKLIAAYPDDYVYSYRYGRSLLEAGKPEAALPYLAQAATKAYGANRLAVATQQVKALKALHRTAEATKVADAAVADSGPWFPKQTDALKAELKS
ncbi:thioredoxin family protein [Dyella halodurans]|uniref:Thioredoxin family protein n=1 Tax=Dyella halodurans TaxID=1920171 RepID=A0ABV9BWM5_9GAMM|nr:thioredoxin family protein [Dyella halodurans]